MSTPGPLDVAAVLRAGALAPSSHNTQPWDLAWRDGAVKVRADDLFVFPTPGDPGTNGRIPPQGLPAHDDR